MLMLKTYCRIAWRNLVTHRLFSLLNIAGLAIGIAVSTVLLAFITSEKSFDTMHAQREHIYRVLFHRNDNGKQETWCVSPPAVSPSLATEVQGVQYAARLLRHSFGGTAFVDAGAKSFTEKNLYWADPSLLKMFSIRFVRGNAQHALDRPNTVVLSASAAQKYFGHANPVGQTITVDNRQTLEITGVYQDFPSNSTLDADMLACFQSSGFFDDPSWSNPSFETYCLLAPQASPTAVQLQMQQMLDRHISRTDQWYHLSLQPLPAVHLYSDGYLKSYSSRSGSSSEVKNLVLLAVLILVIACINYMNLFTARSQKRIKDVSINKTIGATRKQLMLRFYVETGMLTLLALLCGVLLAALCLPLFNSITGKQLQPRQLLDTGFVWYLPVMGLLVTLAAGSYPALYLSRFSAKAVMQQSATAGSSAATTVRRLLVITQFAASAILIISVTVIFLQLRYIRNKNLGYQPENVLAVAISGLNRPAALTAWMNDVRSLGDVLAVSRTQGFPGARVSGKTLYTPQGSKEGVPVQSNRADDQVLDVLHARLLSGHTLPVPGPKPDSPAAIVLNREAVRSLGFTPNNAVGRQLQLDEVHATIVGVVDNFHYNSLHDAVGAYAFTSSHTEPFRYLLVRFRSAHLLQTLEQLEKLYKKHFAGMAFDYVFLDQYLANLYTAEYHMARIVLVFSLLAVFIACLGLFGLAAFIAEQRTKEIGVRKVFGATAGSIVALLSADFIRLVAWAVVLACPVAWWFMHGWLDDFAYRVSLQVWMFAAAGLVILLLAFVTVSFQALKAARMNPARSLKAV